MIHVVTYFVGETMVTVLIYRSPRGRWKILR